MSSFWNIWIIGIVVLNIAGCAWLLMWTRKMNIADMPADGTTGHEYDGIREYNNPLPRWWAWLFYLTIAFSLAYLVLYPGLGSFSGTLGWSQVKQLADETRAVAEGAGTELAKDLAEHANQRGRCKAYVNAQ